MLIRQGIVHLPVQGTWVQSLVGDLGPHMLQGNRARVLGATCHRGSRAPQLRSDAAK